MTNQRTPTPTDLDARYGRSPGTGLRIRVIAIVTAAAFVVVFAAWVVWGGLFAPAASIDFSNTGATRLADNQVEVEFELTVPGGHASSCAIEAMNETYSVVGWKIVHYPASDILTRSFTETVRTTELAETGLIYRCWLT